MSEGEFSELLNQLAASAEELKQEAESIDTVIDGVEARLRSLNLGIELWIEDQPLQANELSVSASNVAPLVEVQLGFGQLAALGREDWCLQLREAEYTPQPNAADGAGVGLSRILRQEKLSKCPREDRVAALGILPRLIQQLTSETEERSRLIRETKELL